MRDREGPEGGVEMIPLYRYPHFAFQFADDRLVPRFHLVGVETGARVGVYRLDPPTGGRLDLLTTGVAAGESGWNWADHSSSGPVRDSSPCQSAATGE